MRITPPSSMPTSTTSAIVRARRDPAHVRGPGPGRKAPLRPRRDLLKRHQLLPALAAVAAAEQPAGLRSHIHGAVRRAHRDAEHVWLRQRHVVEGVAAVRAALQPASPTPDVHRVAVERQALRSRTLQARVRTDHHERVTGRRKQLHHLQDRASRPRVRARGAVRPIRHRGVRWAALERGRPRTAQGPLPAAIRDDQPSVRIRTRDLRFPETAPTVSTPHDANAPDRPQPHPERDGAQPNPTAEPNPERRRQGCLGQD